MKTIVVTGAAGFLGSHLAEFYLRQGFHVLGIDNFLTAGPENIELLQTQYPLFHFFNQDACKNWECLVPSIQGSLAYVFHFASPASPEMYQKYPFETMAVNTEGLLQGLKFAQAHGGRLVFASSSEVYGDPQVSPQTEDYFGYVNSFGPRACYNGAKRLGESIVFEFNRLHQGHHGVVRIFNTYGPRMNLQDGRVVINMLMQAKNSMPLTIFGDGSQTRSFCYVDDLVRGVCKYAESEMVTPMNLGNPSEITIRELATAIRELHSSKHLSMQFKPLPVDDPMRRKPDIQQARIHLQWAPEVDLNKGLQKMQTWLLSRSDLGF